VGEKPKVLLASPRGFCAGVVRAIDIVVIALKKYGKPLYVRREIVHNRHVVDELRLRGVIFVDELTEVPPGNRVVFSAHGVSPEVREASRARDLQVIDATCPLVTKVHLEATKYAWQDFTIVLIGHRDHDEVIGTIGEAPASIEVVGTVEEVDGLEVDNPEKVAYLTQTTLSLRDTQHIIDRLKEKYPRIQGPPSADICYATQNRQNAVVELAREAEVVLVVGSANSSNSRRLVEVAQSQNVPAYLIDDVSDIRLGWLENIMVVGLTAGASAPEDLVGNVIQYLQKMGFPDVETVGSVIENVQFQIPAELTTSPS